VENFRAVMNQFVTMVVLLTMINNNCTRVWYL